MSLEKPFLSATILDPKDIDETKLEEMATFYVTRLYLVKEEFCHMYVDVSKFPDLDYDFYITISIRVRRDDKGLFKNIPEAYQKLMITPVRSKIKEYLYSSGQLSDENLYGTEWFTRRIANPLERFVNKKWLSPWRLKQPDLKFFELYTMASDKLRDVLETDQNPQAFYFFLHRADVQEKLPFLYSEKKKIPYMNSDFSNLEFCKFIVEILNDDPKRSGELTRIDLQKIVDHSKSISKSLNSDASQFVKKTLTDFKLQQTNFEVWETQVSTRKKDEVV